MEESKLLLWLCNSENKNLYNELLEKQYASDDFIWFDQSAEDKAWGKVREKRKRKKSSWSAIAAAASIIFCIIFYQFVVQKKSDKVNYVVKEYLSSSDDGKLPATLGAKIILGTGDELQVTDTLNVLTDKNINQVVKAIGSHDTLALNKLIVPTASFFKLALADGTVVWVNAGSELHFPSKFIGNERRVFLKGEAYFEVKKDNLRPFYVETADLEVKVLGTVFNVSAYKHNTKTTLKEGSVELVKNSNSTVLVPGQSGEWNGTNFKVKEEDLVRAFAWKNGVFYFKEDNILTIAQQLKLWYDLDVTFAKNMALTATYSGEIRRNVNLSEVLKMLTFVSDLEFTLHENKLLILKKEHMK